MLFDFCMPPDGIVTTIRGGGGGWGNPLARPLDAVEADILDGHVTTAGALRDYGVVVDDRGRPNVAATTVARRLAGVTGAVDPT
jgi:N-methylhydantoinase B